MIRKVVGPIPILVVASLLVLAACAPAAPPADAPPKPAAPQPAKPAEPPAAKQAPALPKEAPSPAPATVHPPDSLPPNPQARPGGTAIFAVSRDIGNPNPFHQSTSVPLWTKEVIWEPLVMYDEEGTIQPFLAESWEISPDARQYTFTLRRNVKFHDGSELTADDVVWSVEHVKQPENAATGQAQLANIELAEALDDYTVRFTLEQPGVAFLAHLTKIRALPIVPADSLQRGQVEVGQNPPPGTGPFKFVEFSPNNVTVVERFDDYWDQPLPYLDRVMFQVVPDATVRFTALRAGDVQIAERIPFEWAPRVQAGEVADVMIHPVRNIGGRFLEFNVESPIFQDPRMRQALSLLIDRDAVLDEIFAGFGTPIDVLMPPASIWQQAARSVLPERRQDIATGQQLLQEAGYAGQEVSFIAVRGTETNIAETVQRVLQDVGLNIKVEILESAVQNERTDLGQFDIRVSGGTLPDDPSVSMRGRLYCQEAGDRRGDNNSGYCNPRVDQLFDAMDAEGDQNRRVEIFQELVQVLHEDTVWIYLGTEPRFYATTSSVEDFAPKGDGGWTSRFEGLKHAWLSP